MLLGETYVKTKICNHSSITEISTFSTYTPTIEIVTNPTQHTFTTTDLLSSLSVVVLDESANEATTSFGSECDIKPT